jgi:hypothetical protein
MVRSCVCCIAFTCRLLLADVLYFCLTAFPCARKASLVAWSYSAGFCILKCREIGCSLVVLLVLRSGCSDPPPSAARFLSLSPILILRVQRGRRFRLLRFRYGTDRCFLYCRGAMPVVHDLRFISFLLSAGDFSSQSCSCFPDGSASVLKLLDRSPLRPPPPPEQSCPRRTQLC